MDLDADLYGDLYETDIADPAVEDKFDTSKQPAESTADTGKKPAPATSFASSSTTTTPPPPPPLSSAPLAQQIPTFEDSGTTRYRDEPSLGQSHYEQNYPVSDQHRGIRPSEMKEDGKMFIGGLHWDTTDEGLRAYFEQYGEVDACTIMRDPSGRSRCFAFLTFVDAASVNAVMVKEHVLDGKIIDPKRAVPREEHQRATKLFIGGLAGTVTSESLRTFFSQYGKVIDSTVMIDRETGRSKGFAFLSIENANVQQWLGFGHLEIDGKLIDVKLAQPRFQRESPQHDQQSASSYSNQNLGETRGPRSEFQGGNAPGGNFNGVVGNAAFDPQALASLYQRMFQMANGAMNPMMGGVNPMMMMRGMQTMNGGAGGNMETNGLPRGPRNPPGAMGAGVGPSRQQRGQHNYHPYGR